MSDKYGIILPLSRQLAFTSTMGQPMIFYTIRSDSVYIWWINYRQSRFVMMSFDRASDFGSLFRDWQPDFKAAALL